MAGCPVFVKYVRTLFTGSGFYTLPIIQPLTVVKICGIYPVVPPVADCLGQTICRGIMQGGSGVADKGIGKRRHDTGDPAIGNKFIPGGITGTLHCLLSIYIKTGDTGKFSQLLKMLGLSPAACAFGRERRCPAPAGIMLPKILKLLVDHHT